MTYYMFSLVHGFQQFLKKVQGCTFGTIWLLDGGFNQFSYLEIISGDLAISSFFINEWERRVSLSICL
jgi:hypothetical protein